MRKADAAVRKHRDGQSLDHACIEFATHFADEVWAKVFQSKETNLAGTASGSGNLPVCLLEAYRERGVPETEDGASSDNDTQEF